MCNIEAKLIIGRIIAGGRLGAAVGSWWPTYRKKRPDSKEREVAIAKMVTPKEIQTFSNVVNRLINEEETSGNDCDFTGS